MNNSSNEGESTVASSVLDSERQSVDAPTHRCNGVNGAERHGTQNKCTVCGEYRNGWYDTNGMEIRTPKGSKSMTIDERVAKLLTSLPLANTNARSRQLLADSLSEVARDQLRASEKAIEDTEVDNQTKREFRRVIYRAVMNSAIK